MDKAGIHVIVCIKDDQVMSARLSSRMQSTIMTLAVTSVLFPQALTNPNAYVACSTCSLKNNCRDAWRKYIGEEVTEKCIRQGLISGKFSIGILDGKDEENTEEPVCE
jgi:hypothetical protein